MTSRNSCQLPVVSSQRLLSVVRCQGKLRRGTGTRSVTEELSEVSCRSQSKFRDREIDH